MLIPIPTFAFISVADWLIVYFFAGFISCICFTILYKTDSDSWPLPMILSGYVFYFFGWIIMLPISFYFYEKALHNRDREIEKLNKTNVNHKRKNNKRS